jgi:hypothetical protein
LLSASIPATPLSTLKSFFSPCSSSDDDGEFEDFEEDEEDEREGGKGDEEPERPKGHFERLWASRDPPSIPPSCPPPPIPEKRSAIASPTFGWQHGEIDAETQNRAPREVDTWYTTLENQLDEKKKESFATDPLLMSLRVLLASQLEALSPVLSCAPVDLSAARMARDRLLVKTQKAYFRRSPVSELQKELQKAEEKVRELERGVVGGFLDALKGVVEGCGMALKKEVELRWEPPEQLDSPPLEIITEPEGRFFALASPDDRVSTISDSGAPLPVPDPEEHEPELPSKLSPTPSPAMSTTTSISSSSSSADTSFSSPSPSPLSKGRGRLRGGTFGHEPCTCESSLDHDCETECRPWDPMVVKDPMVINIGGVQMTMI